MLLQGSMGKNVTEKEEEEEEQDQLGFGGENRNKG